jgi:hypothetical protein
MATPNIFPNISVVDVRPRRRDELQQYEGSCEARWRDSTGRQRSRRFKAEETAREFDESIHDHERADRRREPRHGQSGGVYPYETGSGTRWRYVARRSDGSQTSERGFTSEKAARDARRRIVEKQERATARRSRTGSGGWRSGRSCRGPCQSRWPVARITPVGHKPMGTSRRCTRRSSTSAGVPHSLATSTPATATYDAS